MIEKLKAALKAAAVCFDQAASALDAGATTDAYHSLVTGIDLAAKARTILARDVDTDELQAAIDAAGATK